MFILRRSLSDTDDRHDDADYRNNNTDDTNGYLYHLVLPFVDFPSEHLLASWEFSEFPPAKGDPPAVIYE